MQPQSPPAERRTPLEQSAKEFLASPQALIRSFLSHAIPDFPDLSMVDDVLGSSASFTQDFIVKDMLDNLEEHEGHDSQDISTNNSSLALSLPESFDLGPASLKPPALIRPINLETLKLEYSQQVYAIISNLPKAHCPRCRELVHAMESHLSHLLQAHSAALQSERSKADVVQRGQQALVAETKALESRCDRLSVMLEQETKARVFSEESAQKFSHTSAENALLKKQLADLEALHLEQSRLLKDTQSRLEEVKSSANDASRGKDLAQMDRQHLQQELDALQSRLHLQTEALALERQKGLGLEERVQQLTAQLLQANTQSTKSAEERVEKEVGRVREEVRQEMAGLRHTSREISDREARALVELKTSLETENAELRRRSDSLAAQLQSVQTELALSIQAKAQESSELRAELKIKAFELTSMSVTFEQRMQQLRQTELELDALRDEIHAHKSALLRLEGEKDSAEASLQATLTSLRQKVEAYEALEGEVDQAVVRTAQSFLEQGQTDQLMAMQGALVDRAAVVPVVTTYSHPNRRLQQAVQLAQRALQAEGRVQALEQLAKEKDAHIARVEEEANSLRLAMQRSAQPAAYLVHKLRDEEVLKVRAEAALKDAKQQLRVCEARESQYRQEVTSLRERLTSLLQHRGELQTVKAMLQHIHDMEESDSDEDDLEQPPEADDNDEVATVRTGRDAASASHRSTGAYTEEASLVSERAVDVATSPRRRPQGSLQSRALRLGVPADLLAQMLVPPQAGLASGPEVSLPGITVKAYRRLQP